ncbi:MAG: alpha/beta fold hydrolase [Anaerolineae bacterium]
MHAIYLHGFVSGPEGDKARYLHDRMTEVGMTLTRPDLNTPDFEHMTIAAMVAKVAEVVAAAPPGPVLLIGSSLGGFTALQFLKRHGQDVAQRVARLVLLAPAFEFPARFMAGVAQELGPDPLAQWQALGSIPLYHYAYDREMPLGPGFGADLGRWSDGFDVQVSIPTLILHGMLDESVPYTLSTRFAEGRPNVALHLFGGGDHGMGAHVADIWAQIQTFIASAG